jgi:CRISPR-associated protein Cmr6
MPHGKIIKYKKPSGTIESGGLKQKIQFFERDVISGEIKEGADVEFVFADPPKNSRAKEIRIISSDYQRGKGKTKGNNTKTIQNTETVNRKEDENLTYYAPSDTLENLKSITPDNFSLYYHKRVKFEKKERELKPSIKSLKDFNFIDIPFKNLLAEQHKAVNALYPINKQIILKTDWRLILGLGTESVVETSMTLHPVYGFPYIPGQAVKGITRNWIIQSLFKGERKEEQALEGSMLFCRIFGCTKDKGLLKKDYQGEVIFFDAFPVQSPELKMDIMNPHYSEYYSGKDKPPADYFDPVPVPFLTVENTDYKFIIGINEKDNIEYNEAKLGKGKMIDIVEKYLKEALTQHGIGAKTAVGYGYFK